MFALIEFFSNNVKFLKKALCGKSGIKFEKLCLPGLVYSLVFTLVSLPASAASTGNKCLYSSLGTGSPIFRLSIMLLELIILGINSQFIISDMRVIRWFENKKKSRV